MPPVVKLANQDGSGVVALTGVFRPWPENPQIRYERVGESHRMLAGWSGSGITPGETVHFDQGFTESAGTIEFTFFADQTTKDAIETKYRQAKPIRWTRDDWTSTYEVAWQEGLSWDPVPQEGFPGAGSVPAAYTCTVKFNVIRKL